METATELPLHRDSSQKQNKSSKHAHRTSSIQIKERTLPPLPKDWAHRKAGIVSGNLLRLRTQAGYDSRERLAIDAGVSPNLMLRFESRFEPPANHPLLPKIASALARKMKRNMMSVLDEIKMGGEEYEIPPNIYRLMTNQKRSPRKNTGAKQLATVEVRPRAQTARAVAQRARHTKRKLGNANLQTVLKNPLLLARSMVTTFNEQRQHGELHITLPMSAFEPILQQYLQKLHLPNNLLLPDFEEIF